jgi:hypothetical protein
MAATVIGLTGFGLRAEPPAAAPRRLPDWESVLTLRTGAGYKDNVYLAHTDPRGSPLLAAGLEALAFTLATNGPQLNLYADAELNRFLSWKSAHSEYTAFGQAQIEQDLSRRWKGLMTAQYLFQDQVLDVSLTETNREAVAVRGHSLSVQPGVRLSLPRRYWLEFVVSGWRQ